MKVFKIVLIICLFLTLSLIACKESTVETTQAKVTTDSSEAAPITTIAPNFNVPIAIPQKPVIVFCSDKTGNYELYYMSIDGSNVVQVTSNEYVDYYPRFSPDGSKLVFASTRDSEYPEIYLMNSDGTDLKD
ncbi:MAG: hypothetical protein M1308_03655 [Actinobacteria bacterium]|nr:hypothetical protein [Actinomycetota bacterium]